MTTQAGVSEPLRGDRPLGEPPIGGAREKLTTGEDHRELRGAPRLQTAVVTGGGRGIGLEIARKLGARGYAVLLTARNEDAAAGPPSRSALRHGRPRWTSAIRRLTRR
jgi:hypothetical protein